MRVQPLARGHNLLLLLWCMEIYEATRIVCLFVLDSVPLLA
jgi:hypothetical protein